MYVSVGGAEVQGGRGGSYPHLQTGGGANGIKCPHFADLME